MDEARANERYAKQIPHLKAKVRQEETSSARWRDIALHLQADDGLSLRPGALVCVDGLVSPSAAHLNGQVGKILDFDKKAGRYVVQMADYAQTWTGKTKSIEGSYEVCYNSQTAAHTGAKKLTLPLFRDEAPTRAKKLLKPGEPS